MENGNIRPVCEKHAPKPNAKFASRDPQTFVGKYVKKGFQRDDDLPGLEHMWVKVQKVEAGELVGKLDNEPVCCNLSLGDTVRVKLSEIEDELSE